MTPAGSPPAPASPPARRRRARACAPPRLFVAGEPASSTIEPVETPVRINGWPGRIVSWTAEDWDRLGAMQPTGAMRLAGGVRVLFFVD